MKKSLFLFCITFYLLITCYSYAETSASIENLSSNNIEFTTDDILELKVITDQTDKNQINLTSLNNDFEIISQSKQVYHSIINGKASSKVQWIISLRAKNTGKVVIPKLQLGNDYTKPIELVIKEPYIDANQAQEIFIIVEAGNQEANINSPLNIDVKIYVSTDITVRDLNLTTPDNDNYSIFKISDSRKRTFYKNKRYDLFNVTYLAFYKTTGNLEIPKFKLSGHKLNNNKTHDIFSLYQQQWHPFHRENASIPINILPLPVKTDIVADNLSISQEWSNNNLSLEEGDALQRTITITGTNILAEQLPVIFEQDDTSNNSKFKYYVDKPERSNSIINNMLISKITQKITYIPISSGKMLLSDRNISWWDNKEQKLSSSVIKGREYNVVANLSGNEKITNNLNILPNNQTNTQVDLGKNDESNNLLTSSIVNPNPSNQMTLIYLLSFIILVLTLLILLLIIKLYKNKHIDAYQIKHNPGTNNKNNNINKLINPHLKELKNNARAENANLTYKSLNIITNILYPNDTNSILTFKYNLPEEGRQVIEQLLESLYRNNESLAPNWNHKHFLEIIVPFIKQIANNHQNYNNNESIKYYKFPELYPDS